MALDIIRQNETGLFTTILKDETGAVIPQSILTGLTLTFRDKKSACGGFAKMGNSGYIDCGSDPSLRIAGDITIETEIKLEAPVFPNALTNWIIAINEALDVYGYILRVDGAQRKLTYRTSQAGANQISQSSFQLEKDKWYRIWLVRSGASALFYVDGKVTINDISGTHINPVASSDAFKLAFNFEGSMRNTREYNRALTAVEILARHETGVDIQQGLVSEWKLDQDYRDNKGANHGKPAGTMVYRNFGIINGRYYQDVRGGGGGTNNHTIGLSDGLLSWNMQVADNPILNPILPEGDLEEHIAEYNWITATKAGRHIVPIWVKRSMT